MEVKLDPRTIELRLYNKSAKSSHLCLPYMEEWENVFRDAHASIHPQYDVRATQEEVTKMGWLVGARYHGILQPYIIFFINMCSMYIIENIKTKSKFIKHFETENILYDCVIQIQPELFDDVIKDLILEYKVCYFILFLIYLCL